jgi:hypothetical protein
MLIEMKNLTKKQWGEPSFKLQPNQHCKLNKRSPRRFMEVFSMCYFER